MYFTLHKGAPVLQLTGDEKEAIFSHQPFHAWRDMLVSEVKRLEGLREQLTESIADAPDGKLEITGGKVPQYYHVVGDEKTYLTHGQAETIQALAQKRYDEKLLKETEASIAHLEKLLAKKEPADPGMLYDRLPANRQKLVVPYYLSDEMVVEWWETLDYEGLGFREGQPEHFTSKGERVRSKSEVLIANRLAERGILYKYEYPVFLEHKGIVYPDFCVVNLRTRKVYYWEHLGMEDDPKYAVDNMGKLRAYQKDGLFPGDSLLLTHETMKEPLTIKMVDEIIDRYLV